MGWLHRLYYWVVEFAWYCRGETTHAVLVDDDGNQVALTDEHLQTGAGSTMLTIFYSKSGTRYRFVPLDHEDRLAADLVSAYRCWTPPRKTIYGLMVEWKDHQHYLDPNEFAVVGNCLFTQQFTRWLCKHYLHISEADKVDVTVIDSDMVVRHYNGPLQVTSENWVPLLKNKDTEDASVAEPKDDAATDAARDAATDAEDMDLVKVSREVVDDASNDDASNDASNEASNENEVLNAPSEEKEAPLAD